jgi:hypothetical protein
MEMGTASSSDISFSSAISESSLATSSSSTSPALALRNLVVENAAAACVRRGEKEDVRIEAGVERRMEVAARRAVARGAERAMARRESIVMGVVEGIEGSVVFRGLEGVVEEMCGFVDGMMMSLS